MTPLLKQNDAARLLGITLLNANPVRLMKRLSEKGGQRQVYLSWDTVRDISNECPAWYWPILWVAFYTGMRRGEILGMRPGQYQTGSRIITLGPKDTKEGHWKRIPVHKALDFHWGARLIWGFQSIQLEAFKNVWERACKKLDLPKPWPRFHDLRATWRTNARRSGMPDEIQRAIMGHAGRALSVHERYGRISDDELLAAIDRVRFDFGPTEVLVVQKQ